MLLRCLFLLKSETDVDTCNAVSNANVDALLTTDGSDIKEVAIMPLVKVLVESCALVGCVVSNLDDIDWIAYLFVVLSVNAIFLVNALTILVVYCGDTEDTTVASEVGFKAWGFSASRPTGLMLTPMLVE